MKKINKKKQLIYTYIEENIKEIIIISLIFIIGVVFGILLINNVKDEGKEEITNYVKEHGIEKAIEVYCGLTENEWELKQLIMAQYKEAEKIR